MTYNVGTGQRYVVAHWSILSSLRNALKGDAMSVTQTIIAALAAIWAIPCFAVVLMNGLYGR